MNANQRFLAARDFLPQHSGAYRAACDGFQWPALGDFNRALEHFDAMARGSDRPAL